MKFSGRLTIIFTIFILALAVFSGKFNTHLSSDLSSASKDSSVQGVSTQNVTSDHVKEVVDGDTFTLQNGEKVRLIGINTPESGQPYFKEAKSHLEALLASKQVKLITDTQVQDQYGRILAYAYTDSDMDINLDMLKKGFAVTETIPPNVSRADIFSSAQTEARNNCLGIWEGLCGEKDLCIQISEIQSISTDKSKNGEWIEFSNTCAAPQNLSGYLLKDSSASNSYNFENIIIEPKKTLKLYSGCGTSSNTSLYWTCPEQNNFIWNDLGDRAYLYNSAGKLISELGY